MADTEGSNRAVVESLQPKQNWLRRIMRVNWYVRQYRARGGNEKTVDHATRGTIRATWIIAFATAVTAIAAVSQYFVFGNQLSVMQAQLDQMKADRRPWIKVQYGIASNLVIGKQEGRIVLSFMMSNVGHSPAIRTYLFKEIFLGLPKMDPLDKLRQFCNAQGGRPGSAQYLGEIIFPDDRSSETDSLPIPLGDEKEAVKIYGGNGADIFVAGCADYQFPGEKSGHQTRFLLRIVRIRNTTPETGLAIDLRQPTIPATDMALEPFWFGEGASAY